MGDVDLRELARRWREEPGSSEREVDYLRERARRGDVRPDGLRLAARCGHEASRLLLGPDLPPVEAEASEWLPGLGEHGREAIERACVALARRALEVWVRRFHETLRGGLLAQVEPLGYGIDASRPWETLGVAPVRALENMERCLVRAPGEPRAAFDHAPGLGLCEGLTLSSGGETAASCAAVAIEYAHSAVFRARDDHMVGMIEVVYECLERALVWDAEASGPVSASQRAALSAVRRAAVRDELVPWALGYGDPIHERVDAQQREDACE